MSFDKVKPVTRENLGQPRLSVALIGPTKSGKSEIVASMPEPIVVWSDETNNETLEGHMRDGRDIMVYPGLGHSWDVYRNEFLAAITNREVEAATIAVEGYAFRDQALVQHLGLDTPSKDSIAKWGRKLVVSRNTMRDLLGARQPTDNHPGYNIVVTVHLTEVNRKVGDELIFDHFSCHLAGSFKEDFAKMFGLSLLLQSKLEGQMVKEGDRNVVRQAQRFLGHTVAPSESYANLCGDNLGGKGGFKRLPPAITDPTFPNLCQHWGVDEAMFK